MEAEKIQCKNPHPELQNNPQKFQSIFLHKTQLLIMLLVSAKKMITFLLTWTKNDRGSGCETFWFNVGGQKKLGYRKNLEALDPQEQA